MPVTYHNTRDIPLAMLTRFPGNARRGRTDEIRASIRRHGQYRSLVVRDCGPGGLVILAGNHTYDALCAERRQIARCEILTCTDDEARRINLADNRLGELGTYEVDDLVEALSYLDDDYDGTGWTAADVAALIDPITPDEVPVPPDRDRLPSYCNDVCRLTGEEMS